MISISFITSRPEPRFDWFFESLRPQLKSEDQIEIILVDFYAQEGDGWMANDVGARGTQVLKLQTKAGITCPVIWTPPKPSFWQGPFRLPKEHWFAAANARNTAICWAEGEFWASLDDRCVLMPTWMEAVREAARDGKYAVCGPYQKRTGVTVEHGTIRHAGIVTGEDNRILYVQEHYSDPRHRLTNPYSAPGSWYYGCSFGLPLESALKVGGFPEDICDGLGSEDSMFGLLLTANHIPIFFDTRMSIVEDRTPEFLGPVMRREDKGEIGTARDKSHCCLQKYQQTKTALNSFDIRRVREAIQTGHPFPKPSALPYDWFDRQPICEM